MRRFNLQSYVASNLIARVDLETQLNTTAESFSHSTVLYFGLIIKTLRTLTQVDQPYMGLLSHVRVHTKEENMIVNVSLNSQNDRIASQVTNHLYFELFTSP